MWYIWRHQDGNHAVIAEMPPVSPLNLVDLLQEWKGNAHFLRYFSHKGTATQKGQCFS